MENRAVWLYLATLRDLRDLTQEDVAGAVGLSRGGWGNIERMATDAPKTPVLIAAMRYIDGSFDHLRQLADPQATDDLARQLARRRYDDIETYGAGTLVDTFADREIRESLASIQREFGRSFQGFPAFVTLLARFLDRHRPNGGEGRRKAPNGS